MTTTTLITSALIGRARERSMTLGFPVVSAHAATVPSVDECASSAIASPTTTPMTDVTAHVAAMPNLWLGGFQGKGFGSGAYGTKRIHPGRLEGMT